MRIVLFFFLISIFMSAYCQNKQDSSIYYLKLEGDRIIYGQLEYTIPYIGGDYVKINDTSYYTPDITSFNCSWGYFAKFQPDPSSDKVEIFKRSKEGKINFYIGKTTLFSGGGGNMGPMAYDYKENYFSKDNVHLLAVNYDNLSKNLSDNPKSVEFLQQYKTVQYWKWGLAATGIIAAVIGIACIDHKQIVLGSIVTILSAVIFQLSWTQDGLQDTAMKNAIRVYNE